MTDHPAAIAEREPSKWVPIDFATPVKWKRSKAWRLGNSCWIVAVGLCPTSIAIGGELLTGFGKGVAIYVGPLWFALAANFERGDHITQSGESYP